MSILSFFSRSILTHLVIALAEKLRRISSLPGVCDHGKSVRYILWNKRIPAGRSSRKLKLILVASFAILALSIAGLDGQAQSRKTSERSVNDGRVQLRNTSERAVSSGSVRAVIGNSIPRRIANRPIRALVDASKDGGIWWFPQYAGTGFDPNEDHQGKAMADDMRAMGWEVTELPRDEVITLDTLQGFDIVIRPQPFFSYSESEGNAYREAVADGVRLLLMGSAVGYDDEVASALGLRFGGRRHVSIQTFIPHSLTMGIESLAIPWVTVLEMPQESVVLAWGANGDALLGYYVNSTGYVLFSGTGSNICRNQLIRSNMLEFLERNSAYDLQQQFLAYPVVIGAAGPPGPVLISPEPGEVLPQPDAGDWVFKWREIPGARKYQIVVLGPGASLFLVNYETTWTCVVFRTGSSRITDRNVIGWIWSVRAQGSDGQWGNWSEERLFDVAYIQ